MASRIARIALVFSPDDPYAGWQREFVAQTGLLAVSLTSDNLSDLEDYDVLVFVGRAELEAGDRARVRGWYREGGRALVCVGSSWGMADTLGVSAVGGFSKASFVPRDGFMQSTGPFMFVGGERALATSAEELAHSADGFTTLSSNHNAWFLAPEVGRTLCLFGLGRAVGNNRVGPEDGSFVTEDGTTRAEDGCNLDWADRDTFNGERYFLTAHIDCLRQAFVRTVLAATEAVNLRCALLWHWPDNATGAVMCSVEWDSGQAELVRRLASQLARFGVSASWLAPSPGQPQDLYKLLRSLGHDFGLLYKDDCGELKSELIRAQYVNINRLTGSRALAACRGLEGYWHGLTTIYEAIEGAGGMVSVAKGGSKPGTAGFLFGTSIPFFPINRKGRSLSVMELPYVVNQPGLVTPPDVAVDLAMRCHRMHGCLHFTVKPTNTTSEQFDEALDQLLVTLRHNRMHSFLPERLYEFERARRAMKWSPKGGTVTLVNEKAVNGVTIMISGTHAANAVGKKFSSSYVRRYGISFTCATFDLDARSPLTVSFSPTELAA